MFTVAEFIRSNKIPISSIKIKQTPYVDTYKSRHNALYKRLWEENSGDFTFDNTDIKVHKFVLKNECQFFSQFFSMEHPHLDISTEALRALVEWCYTDEAHVTVPVMLEVLECIQRYQVEEPLEYFSYRAELFTEQCEDKVENDDWHKLVQFFLDRPHRSYFAKAFKKISALIINEVVSKQTTDIAGELLPYVLYAAEGLYEIITEEKTKKRTKRSLPSDNAFTVTLIHQETKPKKSNDEIGISHNDMSQLKRLLALLSKQRTSAAFLIPVDPLRDNAPNYLDIIKHPMDLGTIKKRLKENKYTSVKGVLDDIALVWSNALTYNPDDSEIYKYAMTLKGLFERKLESMKFEQM